MRTLVTEGIPQPQNENRKVLKDTKHLQSCIGNAGVSFTDMCYPNAAVGVFLQSLRASSPFVKGEPLGRCPQWFRFIGLLV